MPKRVRVARPRGRQDRWWLEALPVIQDSMALIQDASDARGGRPATFKGRRGQPIQEHGQTWTLVRHLRLGGSRSLRQRGC